MKLELKFIAPYLPYKLKIKRGERLLTMNMGKGSSVHWIGISSVLNWFNSETMISKPMPLLLPLSALTEPLPDGSIPIVECAKIAYKWQKWDSKRINKSNGVLEGTPYDFWLSENKDFMLCNGHGYLHINNQLQLFEYLFANHFDIYGLIPAGLAYDKRIKSS